MYRAVLKKTAVPASGLTEIPVKFDLTPLLTGQIEVWPGYSINEVIAAREKGFDVNIISPASYGLNFYADTLFTTEKMVKDHPDVVKRFVAATLKGWNYAADHPEEAAKATVKFGNKLTYPHELAMMQESIDLLDSFDAKPIGSMEAAQWTGLQTLLIDGGFMKAPIALEQAYSTKYLPQSNAVAMRAASAPLRPTRAPARRCRRPTQSRRELRALHRGGDGLSVHFGELAVFDDLSFKVAQDEFDTLLGPSGCGKSTLLRAIAGLVRPTAGSVRLAGQALTAGAPPLRLGMMFQKPLLLPWRTTLQNVVLPLEIELGGSTVSEPDLARARRILSLVRLDGFESAYPHQLSGGMQQRVAMARAFMSDPDVLLLDEPFGALDEMTRDALNEELLLVWRSADTRLKTVVMVTHSLQEAVALSDRIMVFGARPARLREIVEVPLAHPRAPESAEFAARMGQVRRLVKEVS